MCVEMPLCKKPCVKLKQVVCAKNGCDINKACGTCPHDCIDYEEYWENNAHKINNTMPHVLDLCKVCSDYTEEEYDSSIAVPTDIPKAFTLYPEEIAMYHQFKLNHMGSCNHAKIVEMVKEDGAPTFYSIVFLESTIGVNVRAKCEVCGYTEAIMCQERLGSL